MTVHSTTTRAGGDHLAAPRPRLRSRSAPWLLVLAVAAVGLVATACGGDEPGSGPLRLAVDGRAVVEQADGEAVVVEGNRRVELGSRVEMVSGTATLEYPDGPTYELREGLGDVDHTSMVARERPHLETGDLLVVGASGDEIDINGAIIRLDGDGKIGRRLSLVAQVYEGRAEVISAGQSVSVPALRQAAVPSARLVPAEPSPLVYDPTDAWDRRYLAEAVALGDALVTRARGFTAQLQPGEGRSAGFYRLLLPELENQPGFTAELVDVNRPPGETLVGAAIAVAAGAGDGLGGGEFQDRWSEVFSFRGQGADWGLVALDQQVAQAGLVDRLDAAIARAPLAEIAGGPLSPTTAGPGGSPPPPAPGPGGGPTTAPPPTEPPPPPPTEPPPPDPGDVIDDLIDPLVDPDGNDGLLDRLTTPPPDDSDDDGGLLGNLLTTVEPVTAGASTLVEDVVTVLP